MTNHELQKFLQRFPVTAQVKIKTVSGVGTIAAVEMAFDTTPIALKEQNLSWSDLVQEKIEVHLVAAVIKPETRP